MDVEEEEIDLPTSSSGKGEKKRFEVKKVKLITTRNFTRKCFAINEFSNLIFAWSRSSICFSLCISTLIISHESFSLYFQWNAVALWAWGKFVHNFLFRGCVDGYLILSGIVFFFFRHCR